MPLNVEKPAEDVMVALNNNNNGNNDDDNGGGGEVALNDNDEGDNNDNDDEVVFSNRMRTMRPLPVRRGRQCQPCWR